jgi:hypothetical protein
LWLPEEVAAPIEQFAKDNASRATSASKASYANSVTGSPPRRSTGSSSGLGYPRRRAAPTVSGTTGAHGGPSHSHFAASQADQRT